MCCLYCVYVCVCETHSLAGGGQVVLDEGQSDGNEGLPGDPFSHCAAVIIILLQDTEETQHFMSGGESMCFLTIYLLCFFSSLHYSGMLTFQHQIHMNI